jgi:superfamily II DNA or RNA helicase
MTKHERDFAGGKKIEITDVECYELRTIGGELQLITNSGYLARIGKLFIDHKIPYEIVDLKPPKNPQLFVPRWDSVAEAEFRTGQREVLEALSKNDRGRIWWATGTGKSYLIPLICKMYPKLNIVVTTKYKAVLDDLYKNLSAHLPSVGIYRSGKKVLGRRVMCYSAGCLHHADIDNTHLLIADEVHELATDKMFATFAQFKYSRMYGLSANASDRFDGADFELEGIFGPVITSMSYQEGVANGMIVPLEVHWRNVYMDRNPGENYEGVPKMRHAIWRNKYRNALIAKDAQSFPDDQVLIVVNTFDHACHLKQMLPDFTLVYAADDKEADIERYINWKLIPSDEPKMSADRLERLKSMFEHGTLRKVIATTVWNRGVNFKELQVLIRADAGSSAIVDTQVPGRLSRTTEKYDKHNGILIDYLDQFDAGLKRKAGIRKGNYDGHGWRSIMPNPASKFQQAMEK